MVDYTENLGMPYIYESEAGNEVLHNESMQDIDALLKKSVDTAQDAAPGSPSNGDTHLVETGSGAFAGHDDEIAYYYDGWSFFTPLEGWEIWIDDENTRAWFDGSAWNRDVRWTVDTALTADATPSQGDALLDANYTVHEVTVVASDDDCVTLPAALAGMVIMVFNRDSTNVLQVFPASGDYIGNGAQNKSIEVAAGLSALFVAVGTSYWSVTLSAAITHYA